MTCIGKGSGEGANICVALGWLGVGQRFLWVMLRRGSWWDPQATLGESDQIAGDPAFWEVLKHCVYDTSAGHHARPLTLFIILKARMTRGPSAIA